MKYRVFVYQRGPSKGVKEAGIYTDATGNRKYLRIRRGGRDSFISVGSSLSEAIRIRDTRRMAIVAAKMGIAVAPDRASRNATVTVQRVVERYEADGYPNKRGVPRKPGRHLQAEKSYCKTLGEYFNGQKPASDLEQDDLDQYHDWRVETIVSREVERLKLQGLEYHPAHARAEGHCITDLELNCLNNAMRWAVRKKLLRSNPIESRPRYYSKSDATHCREFTPSDTDELHSMVGILMSNRRSEALGWQLLFEALTSLRCEEATMLRVDSRPDEPGGLTADGGSLCVGRAEKSAKVSLYVPVNEGLKAAIDAHRVWHAVRYRNSPWFFPGRKNGGAKAVDKSALTKALDRLFRNGVLKKKYTSHGAGRAFYVLVRRSQGASDTQIAFELNHVGGVASIEQVYGLAPEHWKNGNGPKLSWLPKNPPAWTKIKVDPPLSFCSEASKSIAETLFYEI